MPPYPGERLEWKVRLDRALKRVHATNQAIAARMGIVHSTVSKWRTGTASPSPDEFAYLCLIAGVSSDEILGIRPSSRDRLIDDLEEQTRRAFEEIRRK